MTESFFAKNRHVAWIAIVVVMVLPGCGPREYTFDTAADVGDVSAIEVPPSATNIRVTKDSVQHVATFQAQTDDLESWVTQMRDLKPELNGQQRNPHWLDGTDGLHRDEMIQLEREMFAIRIGSAAGFSPYMLKYGVVRSNRGGGFNIWHDPRDGRTYLWAIYQ